MLEDRRSPRLPRHPRRMLQGTHLSILFRMLLRRYALHDPKDILLRSIGLGLSRSFLAAILLEMHEARGKEPLACRIGMSTWSHAPSGPENASCFWHHLHVPLRRMS